MTDESLPFQIAKSQTVSAAMLDCLGVADNLKYLSLKIIQMITFSFSVRFGIKSEDNISSQRGVSCGVWLGVCLSCVLVQLVYNDNGTSQ